MLGAVVHVVAVVGVVGLGRVVGLNYAAAGGVDLADAVDDGVVAVVDDVVDGVGFGGAGGILSGLLVLCGVVTQVHL